MSFTDRLVLWLHITFALFTIGPVTVAIMSTPRYIRKRNIVVVRYLHRTTQIFAVISLGVLIIGLVLTKLLNDFSKPWLSVALTLFVVAIALLVLIMRDQRRAIAAMEEVEVTAAEAAAAASPPEAGAGTDPASLLGTPSPEDLYPGRVERGRITSFGGVVSVIWLVILVLMVWNS